MQVNGKEIALAKQTDLHAFLTEQGFEASRVAVELNGDVIARAKFQEIQLQNTDSLEVVCFVGGG